MTRKETGMLTMDAVVRRLGITARTLRYYEELGLIAPVTRTQGGHRLYDEATVERMEQILRLKETLGFSLREIQHILEAERSMEALRETYRQSGEDPDRRRALVVQYIEVVQDLIRRIDEKMTGLTAIRDKYQQKLERLLRHLESEGGNR